MENFGVREWKAGSHPCPPPRFRLDSGVFTRQLVSSFSHARIQCFFSLKNHQTITFTYIILIVSDILREGLCDGLPKCEGFALILA